MSDLAVEFAKKIVATKNKVKTKFDGNVALSVIDIDDKLALKLGKEKGTYATVEFPFDPVKQSMHRKVILDATIKAMRGVMGKCLDGELKSVLVVGLGNPKMIADCFGSKTIEKTFATRHVLNLVHEFKDLCQVSCISTNVFGKTGLESFDIVNGVVKEIKPDIVVLLDTLVAESSKRLCTNIQIANVGIVPGSGVDNARKELSKATLGVSTITIGVPFVVYADSVCSEEVKKIIKKLTNKTFSKNLEFNTIKDLIVMPREIEQQVRFCSEIVSSALNHVFNPTLSLEEIETFLY